MKKSALYLLAFCGTLSSTGIAQVVNSGQSIVLTENSLLFVSGDFVNTKGTVLNNGKLEVKGNFRNNDLNSLVFNSDSRGLVALSGDVQEIGGLRTVFPSLALSGTGDKILKTDIDVTGILSLGNKQLYADEFSLHIINPNPDAIIRGENAGTAGTGFISTETRGALIRNTNSDLPYLFPLGSSRLNSNLLGVNPLYRPLQFKPQNSFENTFSASLQNEDATNAGYDKARKRHDVKNVSDKYFYLLSQKAGTSNVDVTFYQNSAIDNSYSQLVNWTNFLIWEKAAPSNVSTGSYGDDLNTSIRFSSTQPFNNVPFTFSSELGGVNPLTFYNAFSPDGDNKNDVWIINNINLYPDNKLIIYNRWGDEVFSSKGYTNEKAWDGGDLQSGTYYYVLTVTIENQSRVFKGFITMIKKN